MRPITVMMGQWRADTKCGDSLRFERCRGGYFSVLDEFGLRLTGRVSQDTIPSLSSMSPVRCVKQGTRIVCDNAIVLPCDLYEGDIWYPSTGKVERYSRKLVFDGTEAIGEKGGWWSNMYTVFRSSRVFDAAKQPYCDRWQGVVGNKISTIKPENRDNALVLNANATGFGYDGTADELKRYFAEQNEEGTPVTVIYFDTAPVIEQYDPQPIWAPKGEVNVLQEPVDLSAELSATMLVRR